MASTVGLVTIIAGVPLSVSVSSSLPTCEIEIYNSLSTIISMDHDGQLSQKRLVHLQSRLLGLNVGYITCTSLQT